MMYDEMTRKDKIIQMAKKLVQLKGSQDNFIEIDDDIDETSISEGENNGAWVKAWLWVDFTDTELDKEQ